MWETTVMHKQVSGWTVNFGPNFPDQSLLWNTPPPNFGKLQIWDDQSLLRNTPPILESFRFGMTKVYSRIPPLFGKLQVWDDQSLLQNTPPPIRKTSDLGWPKFAPEYPPPFQKTSDLGWPKFTPEYPPPQENCQRVQVRDFLNTEIYYMWRLYPTRITTSCNSTQIAFQRLVSIPIYFLFRTCEA